MLALAAVLGIAGGGHASLARAARHGPAADYVPGQVIVGYAPAPVHAAGRLAHATHRTAAADGATPPTRIVRVPRGQSIWQTITTLRRRRGVLYAVPNYIAH